MRLCCVVGCVVKGARRSTVTGQPTTPGKSGQRRVGQGGPLEPQLWRSQEPQDLRDPPKANGRAARPHHRAPACCAQPRQKGLPATAACTYDVRCTTVGIVQEPSGPPRYFCWSERIMQFLPCDSRLQHCTVSFSSKFQCSSTRCTAVGNGDTQTTVSNRGPGRFAAGHPSRYPTVAHHCCWALTALANHQTTPARPAPTCFISLLVLRRAPLSMSSSCAPLVL